jgi:U2 small nuclear ribonucleoprotein A'
LLLARNRITGVHPELHKSIPNLTTLVLTQNRIAELSDLDALSGFKRLTHLTLLENPVTSKEVSVSDLSRVHLLIAVWIQNYRSWIISRCPSVRFLDFHKVKDAERKKAEQLFGPIGRPTALASKVMLPLKSGNPTNSPQQILSTKSLTSFNLPSTNGTASDAPTSDKQQRIKLTAAQRDHVAVLIRNATSLQEIAELEKQLTQGRIPGGDAMEM